MDDLDFRKFRGVIIAGMLFLISAWKMIGETKYLIWGQRAEATIDSTEAKERSSRRSRGVVLKVSFHYIDASTGQPAYGSLTVEPDPKWSPGQTFSVQYLPGVDDSGREGVDIVMVTIFIVAVVGIGWQLYSISREANEPIASSRNMGKRTSRR